MNTVLFVNATIGFSKNVFLVVETIMCLSKTGLIHTHTSRVIQAHLEEATPEFIKKDEWPQQSPDCNPLDYAMGLYEGESLTGSERQTDQAGIKRQDNYVMGTDISGRNT